MSACARAACAARPSRMDATTSENFSGRTTNIEALRGAGWDRIKCGGCAHSRQLSRSQKLEPQRNAEERRGTQRKNTPEVFLCVPLRPLRLMLFRAQTGPGVFTAGTRNVS